MVEITPSSCDILFFAEKLYEMITTAHLKEAAIFVYVAKSIMGRYELAAPKEPAGISNVVGRPISAYPRVKINPGFFFFCSKAFSRIIFSVIFKSIQSSTCWQKDCLFTDPPLFSLQSPSGDKININRRGFIDRQRKGVVVARELADVFEKNEKKNKTTSVYRLTKRIILYKAYKVNSVYLLNWINLLYKLSYLNSNFTLTLGYLNPALNNPVLKNIEKCACKYQSTISGPYPVGALQSYSLDKDLPRE